MKLTTRTITMSWLLLVTLTLGSFYASTLAIDPSVLFLLVVLIMMIKGQQIVDKFMELQQAPGKWRLLFLSYVVLVPGIIATLYLF